MPSRNRQRRIAFLKRRRGLTTAQARALVDAWKAQRQQARQIRKGTLDPRALWSFNAQSGKWERA